MKNSLKIIFLILILSSCKKESGKDSVELKTDLKKEVEQESKNYN